MKNHCLFPFTRFFEWVPYQGKSKQIGFSPEKSETMWAPGLWDTWQSKDGKQVLHSFAIITTDPPPEVETMGHDRSPIFLKENYIDDWLTPKHETKSEIYEMLEQQETVKYENQWV